MKNFNVIGVTGNMGSGKSSLVKLVENRHKDIFIMDCDKIVHSILKKKSFVDKVKKIFENRDIFKEDNHKVIDSKKIGRIIFQQENFNLKKRYFFWMYNYLSFEIIKTLFKAFIIKKYHLMIMDAPILFQSKFLKMICFPIVTVYIRDQELAINRIKKRNPEMNEDEIRTRMNNQKHYSLQIKMSEIAIENNSTIQAIKRAMSRTGNKTQKIKISELKKKLRSLKQSLDKSENSLLDINYEEDKKQQKSQGGKIKNKFNIEQPMNLVLNDFQVFNNDLQCLSRNELIQLNKNVIMNLQSKYKAFEFYQNKYQEIIQNLKRKIQKQKLKIKKGDKDEFEYNQIHDAIEYQRYENMNNKIIELEKSKQDNENLLQQREKKINTLKKQKTNQEIKFSNEKNILQDKINSLQKKVSNYNSQLKNEKQNYEDLKLSTEKQVKKQTSYLQNENKKLLKEIKNLQNKKFSLQSEVDTLQSQNERQQMSLKELKKNCKNIEEKMLEYQQQVDNYDFIKTERDNFKTYIQQLEKQNKQNLQKFLDIQKDYLKLNGEKILWNNFEQDVKNFNNEKEQIINKNITLQKENKEIKIKNNQQQQQLEDIQQKLLDQQFKQKSVFDNYQTQSSKIETLIKENQNLQNKVQKNKDKNKNYKNKLNELQQELYQTKADLEVQKNKHKMEVFQQVRITLIIIYQQFLRSIITKRKFTYKKQQDKVIR